MLKNKVNPINQSASLIMNEKIKNEICLEPNAIYVIGDRGVGKTNLIKRFKGELLEENEKKKENSSLGIVSSQLVFQNSVITFKDLSDTPKWKFTKFLSEEIEVVKAVIVVFSLESKKTFEYSKLLIHYLLNSVSNTGNCPNLILIGNKNDLLLSNYEDFVNKQEVNDYVDSIKNLLYFEVSVKNNVNITEVMDEFRYLDLEKTNQDMEIKRTKRRKEASCLIF